MPYAKVKRIKQELQSLMKSEAGISISQLRFGSLGDEVIMSFNIDDDHYQLIFEKMKQFGANLLMPVIKKVTENTVGNDISKQSHTDTVLYSYKSTTNAKQNPSIILEKAIKDGDYETLIKVSKDVRNRPELTRKAKDNIYNVVVKEIEKVYELGKKSGISRRDCIERLIKISADKDIKAMYKIDALKFAGLMAVNLCALSIDYISYLVKICNNNAVQKIVNVKAVIALSGLLLPEVDSTMEELDYLAKYLNINWLLIAYDVVIVELSTDEKDKFIQLINAVKGRK